MWFLRFLKLTSSILSFYVDSSVIKNCGLCQDLREEWKNNTIIRGAIVNICWSSTVNIIYLLDFQLFMLLVRNILIFICHRTLSAESVKLSRLTCGQWI